MKRNTDDAELRKHLEQHLAWCPDGEARLPFLALALCGEAGELGNLVKKQWRGDPVEHYGEIVSELADIGNYALKLAMHLGVDLRAAMTAKLIEVEQRPAWKRGGKVRTLCHYLFIQRASPATFIGSKHYGPLACHCKRLG